MSEVSVMDSENKLYSVNNKIDLLHIPHTSMLHWFTSGDKQNVLASMRDKEEREFGIRFFLEDLRAGTVWAHITIDNPMSITTGDGDDSISYFFEKTQDGFLKSVFAEVLSTGCIEAFKKTGIYIFSILSSLCFFYRRPFRIHSIMVIDSKYKVTYFTRKTAPKPEPLKKPLASFSNSPIGSLLAIYRDGMNSVDIPYRYICFFKIYEAWYKHRENFFNTAVERPILYITSDLLAGFYREHYHQEFINKTFSDENVFKTLNEIRKFLVHPVIDRGRPASFCNLDQIDLLEALEIMSNLIERIVTKVLDNELSLLAVSDTSIQELLKIYQNK